MTKLQVGDEVKYSVKHLRSTGCFTGDVPFARGKILALKHYGNDFTLASVDWKNPNVPERVNVKNLCKSNTLED